MFYRKGKSNRMYLGMTRIGTISLFLLLIFPLILSPESILGVDNQENDNSLANYQFKTDYDGKPVELTIDQNGDVVSLSNSLSNHVNELNKFDSTDIFTATLDTETNQPNFGYSFIYNETEGDDGTHVQKSSPYNFTVNPTFTDFTRFDADIDSYTETSETIVEAAGTTLQQMSNLNSLAQGYNISYLGIPNTNVTINQFQVKDYLAGVAGIVIFGQVWNATLRGDGAIVPHKLIGNTSTTTDADQFTEISFTFTTPVTISSENTFSNSSGGYIFFVLRRVDTDSNNVFLMFEDQTNGDAGETYIYTSGIGNRSALPVEASWGTPTSTDMVVSYNGSFGFNPREIETRVEAPRGSTPILVETGGIFVENELRIAPEYSVYYNQSKVVGLTVLQNITYTVRQSINTLATVAYQDHPTNPIIDWVITYPSIYGQTAAITKYFMIPSTFTVSSVELDGVVQTPTGNYSLGTLNGNQSVTILMGTGTYRINATTSNLLYSATLATYVNNSGWIEQGSGKLGVQWPSEVVGDQVNSTITNFSSLGIIDGSFNASLRTTTGAILGNQSTLNYIDTSNSSRLISVTNFMSFSTFLDPNLPSGIWTFQFRWSNKSAAGATAIEFTVNPVTTVEIINPVISSVDILENEIITIDIVTLDYSRNSSWGIPGNIIWDFGSVATSLVGMYNLTHYWYQASINTSIALNDVRPNTSYILNATFTDGTFVDFDFFTLNIFYRGDTNLVLGNSLTEVEFGSDFWLDFAPINVTDIAIGGNGEFFSNEVISFELNTSYSQVPIAGNGRYNLSIPWNNAWLLGSENYIALEWFLPDFRNSASFVNVTYSFQFDIIDSTLPQFVETPNDQSVDEFVTPNNLQWNVSDSHPNNFILYRTNNSDTQIVDSGSWLSNVNITFALGIGDLINGNYNFTLVVFDTEGNQNKDTVFVDVFDTIAPRVDAPSDYPYEQGDTSNVITWTNPDDLNAFNYTVLLNGSLYGTYVNNSWISGNSISVDIDGLMSIDDQTTYNFTLILEDTSSNQGIDTVLIIVTDTTIPMINTPSNITYEEGVSGNQIQWIPNDLNPDFYEVILNNDTGNLYDTSSWNGVITINIDSLTYGLYNFTIIIYDDAGLFVTDTVFVFVEDTTIPGISAEPDIQYSEGEGSGLSIIWTVTDINPANYTIFIDGVPSPTISIPSQSQDVGFDASGRTVGLYNITISVMDLFGNVEVATVFINVVDLTAPSFTQSSDLTFSEGTIGNELNWTVTELYPLYYLIFIDSVQVTNNTYLSTLEFVYNLDSLTPGVYNVTLQVFDTSLNFNIDEVTVTVQDTTNPVITGPTGSTIYVEGSGTQLLVFNATDTNAGRYEIYIDTVLTQFENWTNSSPIEFELAGFLLGSYTFRLVVFDVTGNSDFVEFSITVLDETRPELIEPIPINFNFTSGVDLLNIVSWTFTDNYPAAYDFMINRVINVTGTWASGVAISFNIDDFAFGSYNLTMIVRDTSGNIRVHSVFVEVKNPDITETSTIVFTIATDLYEGDYEELEVIGWQNSTGGLIVSSQNPSLNAKLIVVSVDGRATNTVVLDLDFTPNELGLYDLLLNYTSLLAGTYIWNFTLTANLHTSGFFQSPIITINPHTIIIDISVPSTLTRGEDYPITATVKYSNPTAPTGLALSSLTRPRDNFAEGILLEFIIVYQASGDPTTLLLSSTTNSDGVAIVTIIAGVTENIDSIERISASASSGTSSIDQASQLSTLPIGELPEFNEVADWRKFIDSNLKFIQDNITLIIIVLITFTVIFLAIWRRYRKRKSRIRTFLSESENAAHEIDGLRSIQAILMTSGNTGIPFYENTFQETASQIDLSLVSGLTTALSSFMSEIDEKKMGFEVMQRSGLSITLHKSENSMMIIVSSSYLPESILEYAANAHAEIDKHFKVMILDVLQLNDIHPTIISDLVENNGLKLSLKGFLSINESNLKKIQDNTSITRKLRSDMNLLKDLVDSKEPLTLDKILDYLVSKGIKYNIASRIVYLGYVNEIII